MATEEEIKEMAESAELARAPGLDNMVYDEEGEIHTEEYWQAWMGDPLDAFIQVTGEDEEEARENLGNAAWEMMETRQVTTEAAETPVSEEEGYDPPDGEEPKSVTATDDGKAKEG